MQVTLGIDYYMQCIILFMIMVVVMTKMLIQTILFEVKLKKKIGGSYTKFDPISVTNNESENEYFKDFEVFKVFKILVF